MTYAVLGATGQQGGAVVDALLAAGQPVRALVRDPDKDAARALTARGVELVVADADDPESVTAALDGVAGFAFMTTFAGPDGTAGEARTGRAVAEAADAAGVPRVVYLSVGGAERETGIPHFESKRRVEERLAELAVASYVVRPVFFMENLAGQLPSSDESELVLRLALPGDVPLQMVAVRDIGRVAAALLTQDAWPSEQGSIEIAGDELTGEEAAARIGAFLDRPARFEELPLDALPDDDLRAMFAWFTETPAYAADLEATRALDPELLDLAAWLRSR